METRQQNKGRGIQSEAGLSRAAAKILRTAFSGLMQELHNGQPYRFSEAMLKVLWKERQARRALTPTGKETLVLVGFEFARNGELGANLLAPICGTAKNGDGSFSTAVAPFMPIDMKSVPEGTTHIKMMSVAAELDLQRGLLKMVNRMACIQPWEGTAATFLEQCHTVKLGKKNVYLAVGMVCYRERNGVLFALKNGKFNPLTVVQVVNPKNLPL